MSREEIEKLLGGYATGTLGEAERLALFAAALEDQELFNALAKEQALRDVLQDPSSRRQLLDALKPAREAMSARAWQWLRRPGAVGLAGGLAALLVVGGLVLRRGGTVANRVPRKIFEPATPRQTAMPGLVLPPPPVLRQPSDVRTSVVPAAAPALPPFPPESVAKLTVSVASTADAARQLYFRPMAGLAVEEPLAGMSMARSATVAPAAAYLGVQYGLLVKTGHGEYAPARLDRELHAGDSVRLRLVPNDGGYLYLFQRDSAGAWQFIASQRAVRRRACQLPAAAALEYDEPGAKQLLVVFSQREEPAPASLATAEVEALAASAGAHVLKSKAESGENAYAVEMHQQAGQQKVVFEVTLNVQ